MCIIYHKPQNSPIDPQLVPFRMVFVSPSSEYVWPFWFGGSVLAVLGAEKPNARTWGLLWPVAAFSQRKTSECQCLSTVSQVAGACAHTSGRCDLVVLVNVTNVNMLESSRSIEKVKPGYLTLRSWTCLFHFWNWRAALLRMHLTAHYQQNRHRRRRLILTIIIIHISISDPYPIHIHTASTTSTTSTASTTSSPANLSPIKTLIQMYDRILSRKRLSKTQLCIGYSIRLRGVHTHTSGRNIKWLIYS